MSTTLKTFLCLALSAIAIPAFAVPPKDIITVTAQNSANNVVPTSPQPFPRTWFYVICVQSGGNLSDTLHLHFTVADTDNDAQDEQATISFAAVGNPTLKSGITVPSDVVISEISNPTADVDVPVSMTSPADGTYHANLQISVAPPGSFTIAHDVIHIQVTVGGACSGAGVSCFFTDSNFLDLTDCSGASVTSYTGGRFQVVTNAKKIATATNPGQFYYNMLWSNTTGSDQEVTVYLTPTDLTPSNTDSLVHPIAQAAHAYFFNTATGFTDPLADWNFVNSSGQPCGPSGPCPITVPANNTLFVTWHLVWSHIGQNALWVNTGCANANAPITAKGEVIGTNIDDTCTADALGYRKK